MVSEILFRMKPGTPCATAVLWGITRDSQTPVGTYYAPFEFCCLHQKNPWSRKALGIFRFWLIFKCDISLYQMCFFYEF